MLYSRFLRQYETRSERFRHMPCLTAVYLLQTSISTGGVLAIETAVTIPVCESELAKIFENSFGLHGEGHRHS